MSGSAIVRKFYERYFALQNRPLNIETDPASRAAQVSFLRGLLDDEKHNQFQERFLQAIDRLEPREKQIFEMRQSQGLSNHEISKRLGISESEVSKRYLQVMRKLVDILRGMAR